MRVHCKGNCGIQSRWIKLKEVIWKSIRNIWFSQIDIQSSEKENNFQFGRENRIPNGNTPHIHRLERSIPWLEKSSGQRSHFRFFGRGFETATESNVEVSARFSVLRLPFLRSLWVAIKRNKSRQFTTKDDKNDILELHVGFPGGSEPMMRMCWGLNSRLFLALSDFLFQCWSQENPFFLLWSLGLRQQQVSSNSSSLKKLLITLALIWCNFSFYFDS